MDATDNVPGPHETSIYTRALSDTERNALAAARQMDDLAEEIAVLRVRLATAIAEHPEDFRLLRQGMSTLVKAVALQYRLSPRASRELADHLAGLMHGIGDQLGIPRD